MLYTIKKFTTKGKTFKLVLTKHFNSCRKNEDISRGKLVFNSSSQIINLFNWAFERFDLTEFTNKNKIVLIFNHNNEQYGLLLKLERNFNKRTNQLSSTTKAVAITVDKIDKRHFTNHVMFVKEENRFYLNDYVLPKSNMKIEYNACEVVSNYRFDCKLYMKNEYLDLLKNNIQNLFLNKLFRDILKECNQELNTIVDFNSCNCVVCLNNNEKFIYLSLFFELGLKCDEFWVIVENIEICESRKDIYCKEIVYIDTKVKKKGFKIVKKNNH